MATVHDLTLQFNTLVLVARERGVARWARHHKSDFSSRQLAEDQLARLQRELGPSEMDKAAARMAKFNASLEEPDTNEPGDLSPEDEELAEGLPTKVYLAGQPVPMTVRVRPPGEPDLTDPMITLQSHNWEVDITWPAGKARHNSMAPHWLRAAGLAVSAALRDNLVPGSADITEVTLTIRRK